MTKAIIQYVKGLYMYSTMTRSVQLYLKQKDQSPRTTAYEYV